MGRRFRWSLLVSLRRLSVLALLALLPASGAAGTKVDLCHAPPGNPDNRHTIRVSEQALPGHLAHGDTLGSCSGLAVNPLDEFLQDPGALSLSGVSAGAFNPRNVELQFALQGGEFHDDLAELSLTINGSPVSTTQLSFEPTRIMAIVQLANGRNDIALKAYDTVGRPLYLTRTVWAGANELTIFVIGSDGLLVMDPVTVTVSLSDDPGVSTTATVDAGVLVVPDIPSRTILVEASTADDRLGVVGGLGTDGAITVELLDFEAPSAVDNNDLGLGTDGWNVGSSPVSIIEHVEGFPAALRAVASAPA